MGRLRVVVAVGACAVAMTVAGAAGAVSLRKSPELLKNPGAESGFCDTTHWELGAAAAILPSIFARCGNVTVAPFRNRAYTDSDVPDKGQKFSHRLFTGNNEDGDISQKCMNQSIYMGREPALSFIHSPHPKYTLSAWLGVAGEEDKDDVYGKVCFYNDEFERVGCAQIAINGPTQDRLHHKSTTGTLPRSAIYAVVAFELDEDDDKPQGRNRAAFDNASFTLSG